MTSVASKPLPSLRAELELVKGAPGVAGEPSWLLHDPLLNRFLKVDVATFVTLQHWRTCRTIGELVDRVNQEGRVHLDEQSLVPLIGFLQANRLTVEPPAQGWRHFARENQSRQHSLPSWLVHNYLFVRLPLVRPQQFLERTLPLARCLASSATRTVLALMGGIGLYLVSREWDAFMLAAQNCMSWEGMLLIAISIGLVKLAHELGHAYTTVAYGCRVHTMGVAFVVLAPLFYTDVTDSWRLRDRRQRMAIDSAGIKVELGIAAAALFFWAFLPEGGARNLAFTLSAVSVVSSLAVNLNPFMRFDGYFLLSEQIGIDNLQQRSFELGRWKMRELLFGFRLPAPEMLSRRCTAFLVAYAWATWIYRLVLFTGIALMVYSYFFKVLGILLFAVEIVVFILQPILHEVRHWIRERSKMRGSRRPLVTASVVAIAACLCIIPWSTRVAIPAVAESAQVRPIHSGRPARIADVRVTHGAAVKAGDVLVALEAPELEQDIVQTRTRLALAKVQHGRRGADAEDRASSMVLESSIASLLTRLEGLEKEQQELILRAPFDGTVVDLNEELHPGRWISPRDVIAIIAGSRDLIVRGYVAEGDLWRISPGSRGIFVPEIPTRQSVAVHVELVATSSASEIEIPDLASAHAGSIGVMPDDGKRLVPTGAQYLVRMVADRDAQPYELAVRGLVLAEGRAESLLARSWRQVLKVLVRESGA